jgi:hypothetical protein
VGRGDNTYDDQSWDGHSYASHVSGGADSCLISGGVDELMHESIIDVDDDTSDEGGDGDDSPGLKPSDNVLENYRVSCSRGLQREGRYRFPSERSHAGVSGDRCQLREEQYYRRSSHDSGDHSYCPPRRRYGGVSDDQGSLREDGYYRPLTHPDERYYRPLTHPDERYYRRPKHSDERYYRRPAHSEQHDYRRFERGVAEVHDDHGRRHQEQYYWTSSHDSANDMYHHSEGRFAEVSDDQGRLREEQYSWRPSLSDKGRTHQARGRGYVGVFKDRGRRHEEPLLGKRMETKRLKMVGTGVPTDTDAKQQISNPGKQCDIMGGQSKN